MGKLATHVFMSKLPWIHVDTKAVENLRRSRLDQPAALAFCHVMGVGVRLV